MNLKPNVYVSYNLESFKDEDELINNIEDAFIMYDKKMSDFNISHYEKGSTYSDTHLKEADLIFFIIPNDKIIGKGQYTEITTALALKKPVLFKEKQYSTFFAIEIEILPRQQDDWKQYATVRFKKELSLINNREVIELLFVQAEISRKKRLSLNEIEQSKVNCWKDTRTYVSANTVSNRGKGLFDQIEENIVKTEIKPQVFSYSERTPPIFKDKRISFEDLLLITK